MLEFIKNIREYKLYRWPFLKRVLYDTLHVQRDVPSFDQSLRNTVQWIDASFKSRGDGGSSAYYFLGHGWKGSYPETTGYIIPTLYNYSHYVNEPYWSVLAKKAAEWLISIQSEEGGWQGLQIGVKCELRIFNTAMILDGLIAAYKEEKDEIYLNSAVKGAKWILSKMDANGLFKENTPVPGGSAGDMLVLACMLNVIQYMPKDEQANYTPAIIRSLHAHLQLQTENGWFSKCNFADSYPGTALLHHVGYTLDGLIVSSELLDDDTYCKAGLKLAKKLLEKFESEKTLPAYINSDWTSHYDLGGKYSLCLTGLSQVAISFHKIAKLSGELAYAKAADAIILQVATISNWRSREKGLNYGVAGSYPISGNYQKNKVVNWAAKYHAESILQSLGKNMPRKKIEQSC